MSRFVLDASVTLSWFIDRPPAPYATQVKQFLLSGNSAIVPGIWQLEVANGFIGAERRGTLSVSEIAGLLEDLDVVRQSLEIIPESYPVRRAIASARQFGVTAYDAAYLDLARDLQLPLATLDRALVRAAAHAGIKLMQ